MLEIPARLIVVLTGLLLASTGISGEFVNNAAADRVLGQSDFDSGSAATAANRMDIPTGIAIDPVSGKVFVADTFNNRVLRFPASAATTSGVAAEAALGQISLLEAIAGLSRTGMNKPRGICFDPEGRLWVVDSGNSRVLRFDNASVLANGANASGVLGQADFTSNATPANASGMNFPIGVAMDSNGTTLYVSDLAFHRVLRFDDAALKVNGADADFVFGQSDFTSVSSGLSSTRMNAPGHMDVDSEGRLWVADSANNRVLRFDNPFLSELFPFAYQVLGQLNFFTGTSGSSATQFNTPTGIAVDGAGNLFVSEANHRVTLFLAAATKSTTGAAADRAIGQPDFVSTTSGLSSTKLNNPNALTTDAAGRLFVCDSTNNRVLRFSPLFTPPSVTLKGSTRRKVVGTRLKLTGTASAELALSKVEFSLNKAAFQSARGTSSWKLTAKPLKPGRNNLTIRATDSEGTVSALVKVRVTRE